MTDMPKDKLNIEVQIDPEIESGQYVNMVVAQHSPSEFVLDFIFIPPGQPKARVKSRVILAPEHAKRLLGLMTENIKRYEDRFGKIRLTEAPGGPAMKPPTSVQ